MKRWLTVVCTGALAGVLLLSPGVAGAADVVYTTTPMGGDSAPRQTEIEQLTDAYESARASAIVTNAKTAATQMHVDALEAKIPVQQALSDAAARELYKMNQSRYDIAEMLLSSESLEDFIAQSEYVDRINRTNLKAINDLKAMEERLAAARAELDAAKAETDARMQEAADALDAAKAQRAAKQQSGVASAQAQATSMGGDASVGTDGAGNPQPEDFRIAASTDTGALNDGADWSLDEDDFIAMWAPRIDAYLAGSPLAGQGENFARSAWRYCIDPRWSAAISNTESSKGAFCIRPHNAWGWGAADSDPYGLASEWESWEEAIDAHARGLANGYGYTISISGARSYCPGTWQSWYNNTLSEMARI